MEEAAVNYDKLWQRDNRVKRKGPVVRRDKFTR